MRGTAQPDGRPYGGSELWSYFLPFVDQRQIKFASVVVSVVCNTVFRLTMSYAFRRYSRLGREVV